MKRFLILILSTFALISCSGYFNSEHEGGDKAGILATVNGDSLSQVGSDEITPFLYRSTNGHNPVLFYSSDQDGDFDIYYAVMNDQGIFSNAVKMPAEINTAFDETFPLVYWDSGTVLISFVRYTNSQFRLVSYQLNDDSTFSIFALSQHDIITNDFTGMTLERNDLSYPGNLLLYFANTSVLLPFYTGYQLAWDVSFPSVDLNPDNLTVYAGTEMYLNYFKYSAHLTLFEIKHQGYSQLHTYGLIEDNTFAPIPIRSNSMIPPQYSSTYNDRQPYVDWFDPNEEYKVYFSSDREGDYDLFRYNLDTFREVMPYLPFAEYLTNTGITDFSFPQG